MASAQRGTFVACLSTAPLPAISAGAAKRNTCQNGKFQGMIASTTPSGSKATKALVPSIVTGWRPDGGCPYFLLRARHLLLHLLRLLIEA